MKPILLHYYQRLRSQTALGIITVLKNPCYKSQEPIMLHGNRESTITAARVGVCLCLGFHLSASLIDTLSRIPISADGKITPAHILLSIHLIYLCIGSTMRDPKGTKFRNQKERAPENREIPPLPRSLSDTAYGQTHLGPNRHKH